MKYTGKLRIALVEPVGAHGGMDFYDISLARELTYHGVLVNWFTSNVGSSGSLEFDSKESFSGVYEKIPKFRQGLRWVVSSINTAKDARSKKCNVAHLHFFHLGLPEYILTSLLKMAGMRIVATIHDVDPFAAAVGGRKFEKRVFAQVDKYIVHNSVSHEELIKKPGVCASDVSIIPHGNYLQSGLNKKDRFESRVRLGIPENAFCILFFGQIKKVKGLDVLLRALQPIQDLRPHVLIAGKPWKDEMQSYKDLARELNLSNIHWHDGYIPNDEVGYYYGAADCIVLPYRKIYQSGVLLQSMSLGLSCVVSDLPGMTEIAAHEKNALVFESENHAELALQLRRLAGDVIFQEKLANEALQYVKKKHSWSDVAKMTNVVYEQAVK